MSMSFMSANHMIGRSGTKLEVPTNASAMAGEPELEMYLQPQWYAAYTRSNHERRVADQLGKREVEHFLPEYESVRKWKDRKVRLQMPLFPGYVFVLGAAGAAAGLAGSWSCQAGGI